MPLANRCLRRHQPCRPAGRSPSRPGWHGRGRAVVRWSGRPSPRADSDAGRAELLSRTAGSHRGALSCARRPSRRPRNRRPWPGPAPNRPIRWRPVPQLAMDMVAGASDPCSTISAVLAGPALDWAGPTAEVGMRPRVRSSSLRRGRATQAGPAGPGRPTLTEVAAGGAGQGGAAAPGPGRPPRLEPDHRRRGLPFGPGPGDQTGLTGTADRDGLSLRADTEKGSWLNGLEVP